jgi:hypothetical protein
MKQVNNRQKMFVKPMESVQKYLRDAGKLQRTGKRTPPGVRAVKNKKSKT